MADEILKRDGNRIVVLGAVTDDSSNDIVMLRVDPTTKRLKATATGASGLPVTDDTIIVTDDVDTTKKMRFEASSITTGTTRVMTIPDADITICGIAATQTLTNKTIDLASNTLTGTTAQFNTALSDGSFATLAGTETLTNKTIDLASNTLTGTTAQFNTALSDGSFATLAGTETLTNKTINLASNTLTGTTAQFNTALSDGSFATLAGTETLTNKTIDLASNTLTGTAAQFNTACSDDTFAFVSDNLSVFAATTSAQLAGVISDETGTGLLVFGTSPVLTTPQINDTSSDHQYIVAVSELAADRTITLPLLTGNDTFVFNAFAATLTNKTIDLTDNTLTGTTAEFNTALSDGSFATLAGTETLSNKTLTAPKFADAGFIADANGNALIIFQTTAAAVNELEITNGSTGVDPIIGASGETNVGIDFLAKGTGTYNFKGTASQAAELRLFEDTDDGTNYSAFKVGTQSGDITYTLPTADGAASTFLQTNGSGTLTWAEAGSTRVANKASWIYETVSGRHTQNNTGNGGTVTITARGAEVECNTTANGKAEVDTRVVCTGTGDAFNQNPSFGFVFETDLLGAADNTEIFIGLGNPTLNNGGSDYTEAHVGIFLIRESGTWNMYASMADDTTRELSGVLHTPANGENYEVVIEVDSGTDADFYTRVTGGTLSSATTLSTNPPSATVDEDLFSAQVNGAGNTTNTRINVASAWYER